MQRPAVLLSLLVVLGTAALLWFRFAPEVDGPVDRPESKEEAEVDSAPPAADPELNEQPTLSVPSAMNEREPSAPDAPGQTLAGRVVDDTGAPVATFTLDAEHKPKGVGQEWSPRALGTFHGGEFRVIGLPVGRWRLRASADRHASSKRESLRLPRRKKGELMLELHRQAQLTGLVINPLGEPQPGATITISTGPKQVDAVTDDEGRFEALLAPGDFECVAKHEVFAASQVARGELGVEGPVDVELRLRSGGRIEGQLLEPDDAPMPDRPVTLSSTLWTQDERTVRTSVAGRFVYAQVAPGTYTLRASRSKPGTGALRGSVEVVEGQTSTVVIGGLNPDAITLSGTVYRGGVGEPKARVWGSLEGAQSFASSVLTVADEEGRYELVFPASGRAQILVAEGGGNIVPMGIVLAVTPKSQTFDVHIPAGRILGRAEDESQSRPSVTCKPEDRGPVETVYLTRNVNCDEDGGFEFTGLPAGSYRVVMTRSKGPGAVVEGVELEPDGVVRGLQLNGSGDRKAEVLVLDSAGKPVSGAHVFALDSAGHLHTRAFSSTTNVEGLIKWSGLGDGPYRFFAQWENQASPFSSPLMTGTDDPGPATVTLTQGGSAMVRVMDGDEAVRARLWLWDADRNEISRTMEALDHTRYLQEGSRSDRQRLGPLTPGTYRVRAKVRGRGSCEGELLIEAGERTELVLQLDT